MRSGLKNVWGTLGRASRTGALVAGLCLTAPHFVEAASAGGERTIQQLAQALNSVRSLTKQVPPYDAVFHRDPMRAIVNDRGEMVTSAGLHGGLSIQGIIWSDQRPLAVVDDELVAQGEVIGPYTITEIKPNGVMAASSTDTVFVPMDRGIEPPASTVIPDNSAPPSPAPSTP